MMERYEKEAEEWNGCFSERRVPQKMRHLDSFESYELHHMRRWVGGWVGGCFRTQSVVWEGWAGERVSG
jgi:hypothetical protein